jgi:hypothetical protein
MSQYKKVKFEYDLMAGCGYKNESGDWRPIELKEEFDSFLERNKIK